MAASGDKLVAVAAVFDKQNSTGSTTSTSYTATLTGGVACGKAFIAPPSGIVTIHYATAGFNSGANDNKSAIQVRAGASVGSGTVFYTVTDDDMILFTGAATYRIGAFTVVSGLTAGDPYNAQMLHKVSAGTGSFLFKNLVVVPHL